MTSLPAEAEPNTDTRYPLSHLADVIQLFPDQHTLEEPAESKWPRTVKLDGPEFGARQLAVLQETFKEPTFWINDDNTRSKYSGRTRTEVLADLALISRFGSREAAQRALCNTEAVRARLNL